MIKRIINCIFALGLVACSSGLQLKDKQLELGRPKWADSPVDYCKGDDELCAVGSSMSTSAADASARQELAAIFQTNVKANTEIGTYSSDGDVLPSYQQSMSEEISASVDEVLQGVQIKLRAKDDRTYYSFATLDRKLAKDLLNNKMVLIEDELTELLEKAEPLSYYRAVALSNAFGQYQSRYQIVSNQPRASRVQWEQIAKLKKGGKKTVVLKIEGNKFPEVLQRFETLLTGVGYKIISEKDATKATVVLTIHSRQEHLNVKGFEKFSFIFKASYQAKDGKIVGVLENNTVAAGRSEKDAFLKIQSDFLNYIDTNIDKLNLEQGD